MNQCKFCDYVWEHDNPCEYSTDPETHEVTYCGNQACPACGSCQGRKEVTSEMRASSAKMRAIFESKY